MATSGAERSSTGSGNRGSAASPSEAEATSSAETNEDEGSESSYTSEAEVETVSQKLEKEAKVSVPSTAEASPPGTPAPSVARTSSKATSKTSPQAKLSPTAGASPPGTPSAPLARTTPKAIPKTPQAEAKASGRASSPGTPRAPSARTSPKATPKMSPKAKAKSPGASQALRPPSPEAPRRRSSGSLVPRDLQGLPEGSEDFEAAKVQRAVRAAALRVKARKNPRAGKKRVTSRPELLACLFNALGGYTTGYLRSNELLRMAWLLGFEGDETQWEQEYKKLCSSYNWNESLGANRRQFAELLADEDSDAYSNDMELATMVSHLRVEAPKQLPRDDLVKEFFNWADTHRNGRLGRKELLRFAKHLGFQGNSTDWDKEYDYMVRRYHWGTFFSGFRDSRDGCDLAQFSRMLADADGLCFCDEDVLQVELAELEMATGRPYFSRMVNKQVQQADVDQRQKSAVLIQQLWRGRVRARLLLNELRKMLLNRKEVQKLLKAEEDLRSRMAKAAARIWAWWKPAALRRKWLKTMAAARAAKEAKARQEKEAKRKEELQAMRLKELSELQDAETRRKDPATSLIHASLLTPQDAKRFKVKTEQEKKAELAESQQRATKLEEKYHRICSSKFHGRKPKEWRQIRLPWSDNWEESVSGHLRKLGISSATEGERFKVLNCKGVPFSLRDNRLQAASGRRLLVPSDFPMLLNIKLWTVTELQRRLRQPDKDLRQAQAVIQKQIEQLKRGRPGKLMEAHERQKLDRLREEEAELKVQFQDSRTEVQALLRNRAVVMLQAIVRGCRSRKAQMTRRQAAKVIQRGWRGYLSRLRVEHMKVLARQRIKQVKHVRNAESLFEAVHAQEEAIAIRVVRDKDFNPFVFRHAVSQQSLLHAAAQEGLHSLCHELLAAAKLRGMDSFITARDWRGWTALHTAALSAQVECCKELLAAEELTEPPGSLGRNGQTALHVAALQGHLEVVKVLLSTQSFEEEVDRRDRWGRTALHLAVEQHHSEVARSIAEHPAFNSFDAKSAWGRSALDLADSNMKDDLTAAHQRKLGASQGRRRNLANLGSPLEVSAPTSPQKGMQDRVGSPNRPTSATNAK